MTDFHRAMCALVAASTVTLGGCATPMVGELPVEQLGRATLRSPTGAPIGSARLLGHGGTVTLAVVASGLTPGQHGFHLHETGTCTAPDFASAGGHLNPYGRKHGLENPKGPHYGDMPNLEVGPSGTVSTTVDLRGTQAEAMKNIFDADGTAIVIHAGADDNRTDPSGNSGERIACGVLEPISKGGDTGS